MPHLTIQHYLSINHHKENKVSLFWAKSNSFGWEAWQPSLPTLLTTRSQAQLITPAPVSTASLPLTSLNISPAPASFQPHTLALRHVPSSNLDSESLAPNHNHHRTMTPVVDPLYALAEVRQVSPSAAPILTADTWQSISCTNSKMCAIATSQWRTLMLLIM